MEFRLLRADEIECRIGTVKANGVSLLLYKDARCDMNILDETVGTYNWKREHSRDNHNCTVSLWDETKQQWVSKEDVGSESFADAEKGLASDSFKRACFNIGIGRELYTAPFIWFPASDCKITGDAKYPKCYDNFEVSELAYDGRKIKSVKIINTKTGIERSFVNHSVVAKEPEAPPQPMTATQAQVEALVKLMGKKNITEAEVLEKFNVEHLSDMNAATYNACAMWLMEK